MDRALTLLVGVAGIVVGLAAVAVGASIPVTTCVTWTGVTTECTTDRARQAVAVLTSLAGLAVAAVGGRTAYRAW